MTYKDKDTIQKSSGKAADDHIRKAFQSIIETTVDAFIIINQDGIIDQANSAAETMFGYGRGELQGQNVNILIPSPHKEKHNQYISNYLETGVKKSIGKIAELEGEHHNGNRFPIELSLNEMNTGGEKKFMGVIRDITRRKEEQKKLREAEHNYRLMVENATDMISRHKPDGTYIYASPICKHYLGYEPEELIGRNAYEFFHPDDYEIIKQSHDTIVATRVTYTVAYRLQTKNGNYIWFETTSKTIRDEHNKVLEIISISRDITTRKHLENQVEETKNRLSNFMESATEGFMVTDEHFRIVDVNIALANLLKVTKEDLIGITLTELSPGLEHEPRYREYQKVLKTGKSFSIDDLKIKSLFGDLNISLKAFKVGKGMGIIVSDVTERKQFEAQLIKAKEDAEASAKAKQDFLANTSHEIRTPMNSIMGMAEMLSKTNISGKQKDYVEAIRQSTENLLLIINDILDLSKIGSNKLQLEKIGFKLSDVIQLVITNNSVKAKEKNISLEYSCRQDTLNRVIVGDPVRLNQILTNLVNNAIKFTQEGRIEIKITPENEAEKHVNYRFEVSDTGIGIPREKLQDIFGDFTQVDSSTTRRYGGTGLGLSISKRLVEMMGGSLNVESKVNQGSAFYFTLRFKKGDQYHYPESVPANIEEQCLLDGVHMLLVEDQEFNQLVVHSMTESWNCHLETASNGKEAIEKLSTNHFDIILMDIQMPIMDGVETTKFIRNHMHEPHRNIPIIALTAHGVKGDNEKYLEYGMNDYISKPFKNDKLYHVICKHIDKGASMNSKNDEPEKPYDLASVKQIAQGNEDFVKKMISSFIARSQEGLEEMKQQLKKKEWQNMAKTAHRIKPSFKYMGIMDLHEEIQEIERIALEEPDASKLIHDLKKFESRLQYIHKELEKELW
ncbi:MAG: PAS domain S-box protein [Bacteroidales bacterium]|nr:PAS domain S-box protein [Bacteroidales bacterium]